MHSCEGCHGTNDAKTDFFSGRFNAKAAYVRQRLIERRHGIPEAGLRAADTAMPDADGPVRAIVPLDARAVIVGRGPFAPHLVEAPALLVTFITPLLHKLTGIVVRAARAIIVNAVAVGKQRSPQVISRWQLFEGQIVHKC